MYSQSKLDTEEMTVTGPPASQIQCKKDPKVKLNMVQKKVRYTYNHMKRKEGNPILRSKNASFSR